MKRIFKIFLYSSGFLILFSVSAFLTLYFANVPAFLVPAAAGQDPALPSIEMKGYHFHAEEKGDPRNPLIIGLHGGPGDDMESIRPLLKLSDEFHVVLYDQRNSGLSERTGQTLNAEIMYQDLSDIVAHYSQGGRKVILIGHSWGAMLASAWAVRNPDKTERLILAEPGFMTSEAAESFMQKSSGMQPRFTLNTLKVMLTSWFESLHVNGPDEAAQRDYLFMRFISHPGLDLSDNPLRQYACPGKKLSIPDKRFSVSASTDLLGSVKDKETGIIQYDPLKNYPAFKGKTLHIISECNTLTGKEHQEKFHISLFPDSKIAFIKNTGHLMFTEAEEQTLAAVREFLRN